MGKQTDLIPVFVDELPSVLEEGKLYYSEKRGGSTHLCACGCNGETYLPFPYISSGGKDRGWIHQNNNGQITIRPSIGNWSGENPYHAHYYITNNKIEWL